MIEEIKKSISDRDIKFRSRDGDEMSYTPYSHINPPIELNILLNPCKHDICSRSFVLMQYTGLKDKNGNPIYEGDIVKRRQKDGGIIEADNNEYICFIDWFMNGWACRKNRDHCGFTFGGEHIEVIGNIFENPELIQ